MQSMTLRLDRLISVLLAVVLVSLLAVSFLPQPLQAKPGPGWVTGYSDRKKITIDHNKVSASDQSNFPVLINISADNNLRTVANGGHMQNSSGYDTRFTSSDAITSLYFEIEKYTATSGEYIAWVNIPTLSHTADVVIYLYYGNSVVSTNPSSTSTWDGNFKGVWHLKEISTPSKNSTSTSGYDGTWSGSCSGATGQVDGGISFTSSAEDNVSSIFGLGTSNVTMECWAYLSSTSLTGAFIKIGGTSPNQGYAIGVGSGVFETAGNNVLALYEGNRWIGTGKTYTTGWHHFVFVIDASGHPIVYYDGGSVYSDGGTVPLAPQSSITHFGGYTGSLSENRHFTGTLDEIRISGSVRSADWIKTEFNNQSSPNAFYIVGIEQVGDWDSYQDLGHVTQCDYFNNYTSQHTVYMYGTRFAPNTQYRIRFWNYSGGTWYARQTEDNTSGVTSGDLSALHTFTPDGDVAGDWHCTVYVAGSTSLTYDPNDSNLVADDNTYTGNFAFHVEPSSIPEFPTVAAGIGVAGACSGIYWCIRKRRTTGEVIER